MDSSFLELLEIFVKEAAEQQALPGFSDEDISTPDRIETLPEETIEKYKWKDGQLPLSFINELEEKNIPMFKVKVDNTLPTPNSFPELNESNIHFFMNTSDNERIKKEKLLKEKYINKGIEIPGGLENALDFYIKKKNLPSASALLQYYNDFRKEYFIYYRNFSFVSNKYAKEGTDIERKIKEVPLEEFFDYLPEIINKVYINDLLKKFRVQDITSHIKWCFAEENKNKRDHLIDNTTELLKKVNEKVLQSMDLSRDFEFSVPSDLKEQFQDRLKLINMFYEKEFKEEIITYIREQVFLSIKDVSSSFGNIINNAYNFRVIPIISDSMSRRIKDKKDKILENYEFVKADEISKNPQKYYDNLKETIGDFFDFNKLEKMIKFGFLKDFNTLVGKENIWTDPNENITILAEFIYKVNQRLKSDIEILSKSFMDFIKIKDNQTKEDLLLEISNNYLKQSITKRILAVVDDINDIPLDRGFTKLYNLTDKFGPQEIVQLLKSNTNNTDDDFIQYLAANLKKDNNFTSLSDYIGYKDALTMLLNLKKKLNIPNDTLYKFVIKRNHFKRITELFREIIGYISGSTDDIIKLALDKIRSLDTIFIDLENFSKISEDIHNFSKDISFDKILDISNNKNSSELKYNIPKKIHESIIKVYNTGGSSEFISKYKEAIAMLKEKGAISNTFENDLKEFEQMYKNENYTKISDPNFQEYSKKINKLYGSINTIVEFESFKEHYEAASKVNKVPDLFKLDMNINHYLRFRVLRDLDSQYFRVGNETNCCQYIGGEGEEAAIDSFINPMAAVVVLETKEDDDWQTVAQSYFHYVSKEDNKQHGYILDNVEVASDYGNGIKTPQGNHLSIEEIYAFWAKEKKNELNVDYIQSGTGYSGIDKSSYESIYMEEDPRNFSVEDPYSDWEEGDNIDLTAPNFEHEDISKIAKLSNVFHKIAIQIQDDLKSYLSNNPNQYNVIENIEEESFSKYDDYSYGQDAEDIEDDFQQPGAAGVGITDDNGNVLGYVWGYNMTDDELPNLPKNTTNQEMKDQGVVFYTNLSEYFYKSFVKKVKSGKIFYIANLALPTNKTKLIKMLQEMTKKIKASGYEYVSFDALSDSLNLFMGKDMIPKQNRLDYFDMDLIAIIPDSSGGMSHAQTLMRLK
jgi:hypothetical protein